MKLSDFKRAVDLAVDHNHGDDDVLITLNEPYVGAIAAVGVKYAGADPGFSSGEFRIYPDEPIVRKGYSLKDPMRMICRQYKYNRRTSTIYHCPLCGERLKKEAKYCMNCGQSVFADDTIDSVDVIQKDEG